MTLWFLPVGIVLGIVFSVATFAGAVWCVQITLKRGYGAGFGIALAQGFWAVVAVNILFAADQYSFRFDWLFRMGAALVLFYMGLTAVAAERATTLDYEGPLRKGGAVFRHTFSTALGMPLRLFGYLSYFVATGLHLFPHFRGYTFQDTLLLGTGVAIGSLCWWIYLALLAALFGRRVPEPITLKSMNKLRGLAGIVYFLLLLMCTLPLLPGF